MIWHECRIISGLTLILLAAGCSRANKGGEANDTIYAAVNDAQLTESGLKELVPSDYYNQLTSEHKKEIVSEWVNSELLFQEALRQGLDADPEIKKIIENTRRSLLINELLERTFGEMKTPEAAVLRKYYDEHKRNFALQEREYRVRYAAFDSKREADDFWQQVKNRRSFSELAAERSKDQSAKSGGELGIVNQESVADEIWQAIENTVKNYGLVKISEPFRTADRWGCVIVDEVFEIGSTKPFEAVRDQVLELYMTDRRGMARNEFLKKLASKARIVYPKDTESGE